MTGIIELYKASFQRDIVDFDFAPYREIVDYCRRDVEDFALDPSNCRLVSDRMIEFHGVYEKATTDQNALYIYGITTSTLAFMHKDATAETRTHTQGCKAVPTRDLFTGSSL